MAEDDWNSQYNIDACRRQMKTNFVGGENFVAQDTTLVGEDGAQEFVVEDTTLFVGNGAQEFVVEDTTLVEDAQGFVVPKENEKKEENTKIFRKEAPIFENEGVVIYREANKNEETPSPCTTNTTFGMYMRLYNERVRDFRQFMETERKSAAFFINKFEKNP